MRPQRSISHATLKAPRNTLKVWLGMFEATIPPGVRARDAVPWYPICGKNWDAATPICARAWSMRATAAWRS